MAKMACREALEYLRSFERFGIRLGLETTNALLSRLGQPHRQFKSILIAGTNGKGSTCAMLGSVLKEAGFRVGIYTSPEVVELEERIAVDGREIGKGELARLLEEIRPALEGLPATPTFFEVLTALAFMHFEREQVEIAVLEVGMGGRLDATNVVEPLVSVITNVEMDHTQFLGNSIREIAREKAGIIKEGGEVVTAAEGEALSLIGDTCRAKGANLAVVGRDITYRGLERDLKGQGFEVESRARRYKGLSLSLLGRHQLRNAATAIAALEALGRQGIKIDEEDIRKGLKKAFLPGRFEVIRKKPLVILDGAHNVAGAGALRKAAEDLLSEREITLVIGILADKDVEGIVRELAPMAERVIAAMPPVGRASRPERIVKALEKEGRAAEVVEKVPEALEKALQRAGTKGAVLVTGSFYTVAEARRALLR